MNIIDLRVFWSQIIGIANEQGRALKRIAFSPVVREAGDLCVAICDAQGRMLANADTGTPGHINTISNAIKAFADEFPVGTLRPGDVLITNDPWLATGHFFDITIVSPVFSKAGRLIAMVGTCIHHTDIGGLGVGAGARDIHEEGLWIPPMKLFEAGKRNETLHRMIGRNVRTPEHVLCDIAAQVSCCEVGGQRLAALCESYTPEEVDAAIDDIIARSEKATRDAIRQLPAGVYHGETSFDILNPRPGGKSELITLKVALHVDSERGEILADFTGSSPASSLGINVVPGYSHAYVRYAVRSSLNPEWPNNHGSLLPIKFSAPKGTIVNAAYPSPVSARHNVGMLVPMAVNKALHAILPDKVVAESIGGKWSMQMSGLDTEERPFVSYMCFSGGMGARATKPGLPTTAYPIGLASVPVEIMESAGPVYFLRKELCSGSGGHGRQTGGDGQIVEFKSRAGKPWLLNCSITRTEVGPDGMDEGGRGMPGRFLVNGEKRATAGKFSMEADDVVTMQTPGGGGFGKAAE